MDSEYNYQQVERFFEEHVRWFFEDMTIYDTFANNHPVVSGIAIGHLVSTREHMKCIISTNLCAQTHLHNLLTLTFGCTDYRVMADELPSFDGSPPRNVAVVMIHDNIIADGEASSGKSAKVKACLEANELLRGVAPSFYRMQYHCDCETLKGDKGKMQLADIGTSI